MKKVFSVILVIALVFGLSACGGKEEVKSVDLNGIYESYSQYLPDMFSMDEDTMLNFLGIDMADCTQAVVSICGDGMRADEVWLIEAKDAAALERLQELAQTRIVAKEDETISYAPDQYAIVTQAQLLTNGNYLALLISPDVEQKKTLFEAPFI